MAFNARLQIADCRLQIEGTVAEALIRLNFSCSDLNYSDLRYLDRADDKPQWVGILRRLIDKFYVFETTCVQVVAN